MFVYTNGSDDMHNPTLRVLQVIDFLCECQQPQRLSDISRALDVPKSTLLPILQTMVQGRYIKKDESDRYYPGVALLYAGAAAGKVYTQADHLRECLKELVEKFGETCYYGVLDRDKVLYIEKIDSTQPLRMLTTIGHKLPAYATGLGKALLMDMSYEDLKKLYPEKLEPLTKNTVRDVKSLYQQLQQAKQQEYSWEIEESTEHVRCFGVPVRKDGEITGAVSIAIPIFRYNESEKERIIEALKETARKLSNISGLF